MTRRREQFVFSISENKPSPKAGFEVLLKACDFDESLVVAFERVAATVPSRIAIGSDVWAPTYRELNEIANRLAHRLIGCGVASSDRIAILMSHDAPLIAAVLGILKVGAIVVVLDPLDPASRHKMIVGDSEPRLIVTDGKISRSKSCPDRRRFLLTPQAQQVAPKE
jgi:non-ribosomal peptide synthetase component F